MTGEPAMPIRLPIIRIGRKRYFADERLGELRNVTNPSDRIRLSQPEILLLIVLDNYRREAEQARKARKAKRRDEGEGASAPSSDSWGIGDGTSVFTRGRPLTKGKGRAVGGAGGPPVLEGAAVVHGSGQVWRESGGQRRRPTAEAAKRSLARREADGRAGRGARPGRRSSQEAGLDDDGAGCLRERSHGSAEGRTRRAGNGEIGLQVTGESEKAGK